MFVWTIHVGAVFFRAIPPRIDDASCPRVAVLMGLKGTDPFLLAGLERLLTQDYPNYTVHFVVDSQTDPAWSLVEEAIKNTGATHATVREFNDVPENGIVNCTNSKVVQALRELPDDACEIIAMADGDVVANKFWLKDLVTPLVSDKSIGVTTGNRWFVPHRFQPGSIVRSLWNMAATNIMYHMNMPWGGCYAIRMSAVREGNLIKKWAAIGALDMFTTREMKVLGLKIEFVPTLMMVNREGCSLAFSFNFIRRQLTWAQLYNPAWPLVVVQSIIGAVLVIFATALIIVGAAQRDFALLGVATAGLVVYSLGSAATASVHDYCVRHLQKKTGYPVAPWTIGTMLFLPLAVPLTTAVQFLAVMHCLFFKRIAWRGSMLEFNGPHDIRVISNTPVCTSVAPSAVGTKSL